MEYGRSEWSLNSTLILNFVHNFFLISFSQCDNKSTGTRCVTIFLVFNNGRCSNACADAALKFQSYSRRFHSPPPLPPIPPSLRTHLLCHSRSRMATTKRVEKEEKRVANALQGFERERTYLRALFTPYVRTPSGPRGEKFKINLFEYSRRRGPLGPRERI